MVLGGSASADDRLPFGITADIKYRTGGPLQLQVLRFHTVQLQPRARCPRCGY